MDRLSELGEFDKRILDSQIYQDLAARELNQINEDSDLELYLESDPELVISLRHMSILKDQVISQPEHGVINLHSGLLPYYRGVMATFWAMNQQETVIGTTLHQIEDSTIDTGAVISQTSLVADYRKSYLWNTLNLYKQGCESIEQAICSIDTNIEIKICTQ